MTISEPDGYAYFKRKLKELTGIDLSAYKDRQMVRRLTGYLGRLRIPSFFVLAKRMERDPKLLQELKDFITINVSEFFRNPERFAHLADPVLPGLHRSFGRLRVWSAGCSIGCEAYTLAILLREMDPRGDHRVLGTDIDQRALTHAEQAVYQTDKLREVNDERKRRFFRSDETGNWMVVPEVRRMVDFQVHDLLQDPYPKGQHLILCRNVVIYFTDDAKERIYRKFAEALEPGGVLLVGSTESVFQPARFGLRPIGAFLYERTREGAACAAS